MRVLLAPLVLAAVLLLASCSGGAQESSLGAPAPEGAGGAAAANSEDRPAQQAEEGGAASSLDEVGQAERDDRAVSYTASVSLEVTDLPAARKKAKNVVESAQGYVEHESSRAGTGSPSTELTVKVPAAGYAKALESFKGLGEVVSLEQQAQDITAELADTQSRVETAEASLERIRDLLAKAEDISDIIELESELSTRQADLEALQARQRALKDRESYSTITLTLAAPGSAALEDSAPGGFLDGLRGGWEALLSFLGWLAYVVGGLLPFLVPVAAIAAALWWLRRRLKTRSAQRRAVPATSDPETEPEPGPTEETAEKAPE